MADEGKNIRSVIKNATQWGLSSRLWGKGDTIATKEEINKDKEKPETPKMSVWPKLGLQTPSFGWLSGWLNLKKGENASKSEVVSQPKVDNWIQNTAGWISVSQQPPVSSPFENNINTPINNIKVEQFNNEWIKRPLEWGLNLRKGEEFKNPLIETEIDRVKRMSRGVQDLYIDAYKRAKNGRFVDASEVLGNAEYQKAFEWLDEKVVQDMVKDANLLASGEYDLTKVLYLYDKYKDLGLMINEDQLPAETKLAMLDKGGEEWGLMKYIDFWLALPQNLAKEWLKNVAGVDMDKWVEEERLKYEEEKKNVLLDSEVKDYAKRYVDKLDKEYEQYYHNEYETKFLDKNVWDSFAKEVKKVMKKQDMDWWEAEQYVLKNGTYNNLPYERFQHETVDQWRFWDDKEKEKEYNKKVKEIEKEIRRQHWEEDGWLADELKLLKPALFFGYDLLTKPGTMIKKLWKLWVGAVWKSAWWYIDLVDTLIQTSKNAIDTIKSGDNDGTFFENVLAPQSKDIKERIAGLWGESNWDEFMNTMERNANKGDVPWAKFMYKVLEEFDEDSLMADAMLEYFDNRYGGLLDGDTERLERAWKENKYEVLGDFSMFLQTVGLFSKVTGLVKAEEADRLIRVAWYMDDYELMGRAVGWINKSLIGWEKALMRWVWNTTRAITRGMRNVWDVILNKITAMDKETREFVRDNPWEVDKVLEQGANSQDILDRIVDRFDEAKQEKAMEWEVYDAIKKSNTPVKIKGILDDISKILKRNWLELTNDGIKINKTFSKAGISKINELSNFINDLRNLGDNANGEGVHWTRQLVDGIIEYDKEVKWADAVVNNMLKDVRGAIDNGIRRDIPALKDIDAKYAQTLKDIRELRQDWIDKDGKLKDGAYSKVRTITNKWANQPKLARIERLIPNITQELKSLAAAEAIERAWKSLVGQYANQIIWVGGWILWLVNLFSGWSALLPLLLSTVGFTLATPKNLVKILSFQGSAKRKLATQIDKIKNWIKLNGKETQELTKYINDNKDAIAEDVKYLYEKGVLDDKEVAKMIENKLKEVKIAWNWEKNIYNKDNNLISNQNKDGVIKEGWNDTRKSEENLWWLEKEEKGVKQWGVWEKTSWQAWNNGGRVSQEDWGYLKLAQNWDEIVANLERIKANNPDGYKMDIHWADKYGNWKRKTFQSNDGKSSVTVKDDGDITSLVSEPGLKRGKELVITAIMNWWEKLDCYEEYLPTLYQNAGFEPVARVKFNAEYAPKDWKGKGQDIIVMMRRNNDSAEMVDKNWWQYEKYDLDDLPVMEYDEALKFRDELLKERKMENLWEEKKNPETWKKYTQEDIDKEVKKVRDKYLKDEKALRELYDRYKIENEELKDAEVEKIFDKNGYINPDGLRNLINEELSDKLWVSDNILASTNHPAVSKITDAFVEMVGNDMIKKAKRGEDVTVAFIWGWGWSWKSGWPKAMISEGFVKKGDKVDMTLDVVGWADELKNLMVKAAQEWVLDKMHFKVAYVNATTEDAGKWAIMRTINQNVKGLKRKWEDIEEVKSMWMEGKNRLYAWRSLPFKVFEEGHLKSVWDKKGLALYTDLAKKVDNIDFMITSRVGGKDRGVVKYIVKKDGEFRINWNKLDELIKDITRNKKRWLDWDKLRSEGDKALRRGEISQRQYKDMFGDNGKLGYLLMLVAMKEEERSLD